MIYDLQKAMIWKRISAWLFDRILLGILVVFIALCLSSLLGYENQSRILEERCRVYEQQYGISLSMTMEEYENLLPEQKQAFEEANRAFSDDQEAGRVYERLFHMSLMITSLSMLSGFLILEFAVPLSLKNGQTLGKKIFSIGVMSREGIRVSTMQMFIRTILGKFTIETMVPVLVGTLAFFGSLGIYGTLLVLGLMVLQLVLLAATRTNALIHDLLAGTVAIDMPSQMIFETRREMLDYKKKIQQDMASRQYD